jgi:hypothetical protein
MNKWVPVVYLGALVFPLMCFSTNDSTFVKKKKYTPQVAEPVYEPPALVKKVEDPLAEPLPINPKQAQHSEENDYKEILSLIENQISALQTSQIPKAYNDYMSSSFKKEASPEQFAYFVKGYPGFSNTKNAYFGNIVHKTPDIYSIQGTLISTSGDTLQVEYYLSREDQSWRIIGIKILSSDVKSGPSP